MAQHFIFYVGQENDGYPKIRGFLDDVTKSIVIYDDCNGQVLFTIGGNGTSGFSGYSGGGGGGAGTSGYSGYSGIGVSGYSGYSGVGISGYSGYSGVGISGYSGYSGVGISGYSGYSGMGGMFVYWNSGTNLINNNYLLYGGQNAVESRSQILITRTSTLRNLYINLGTAPSGVETRTFTIRKNGVNTALTVTITGASVTGSDLVNTVSVIAGDLISILHTRSAGAVASTGTSSVQAVTP